MALKAQLLRLAALLPPGIYQGLRSRYRAARAARTLLRAAFNDWRLYRRVSGLLAPSRQAVLEASILKNYHRIEKGLALREPRLGFGREAIDLLLDDIRQYLRSFGPSAATAQAVSTLDEYLRFNTSAGNAVPSLEAEVRELQALHRSLPRYDACGGTLEVTRADIHSAGRIDLAGFFASRHSVRQFSDQPIVLSTIAQAVAMAQKSPSVCNRQSGRVWVVSDKSFQHDLLALQNGNRGFGDQADKLLIIGSDLNCFLTVGERYQAWIDGGMFAMSLVYALHSLGLGSCCLNWSVEPELDRQFHQTSGIPDDISIIMLLAVGNLPDTFRVAQSPRRPIGEVMMLLDRPGSNPSQQSQP